MLTQREISKITGVSQALLSLALAGQRNLGRRSGSKIAAATGEDLGRVMTMTPAELAAVLARITPKEKRDAHHE